ncbi:MAG: hypothetical protein HQ559_15005 [Lentisphaerae bacterium]|nr:hypothetical protein [Lentisphaerota bacterium]
METTDRENLEEEEQELSPEEKLLKVIQGEDDETAWDTTSPGPADPDVESPADDEEPRLRLADEMIGDEDPAPAEQSAKAAPPAEGLIGTTAPVSVAKRKPSGKTRIGALNQCLGAVIIVLLFLSGLEIWAHAGRSDAVESGKGATFLGGDVRNELPDLEALQKQFKRKKIWRIEEEKVPVKEPDRGPRPKDKKDAEEKLKLIGLSAPPGLGTEAILHDRTDDSMHFVKVGEKLPFNQRELQVEEIHRDHVVLSEDEEKYTIR